jgi:hypothetical protein
LLDSFPYDCENFATENKQTITMLPDCVNFPNKFDLFLNKFENKCVAFMNSKSIVLNSFGFEIENIWSLLPKKTGFVKTQRVD